MYLLLCVFKYGRRVALEQLTYISWSYDNGELVIGGEIKIFINERGRKGHHAWRKLILTTNLLSENKQKGVSLACSKKDLSHSEIVPNDSDSKEERNFFPEKMTKTVKSKAYVNY